MVDGSDRQYLDDVPRGLQDLIYENKGPDAIARVMTQRGISKLKAAMEVGRILSRMNAEFPEAMSGLSDELNAKPTVGQKPAVMWIFVSLFLVVGGIFFVFGVLGLVRANASKSWPTADGKITHCKVVHRTTGTGTDRRSAYLADVRYVFTVSGTEHTGDCVSVGDHGRGSSKHARRIVKRYPRGSAVSVSYKPGKPDVWGTSAKTVCQTSISFTELEDFG